MTEEKAPEPVIEWRKPSIYSVIVFVVCLGALTWAAYAKIEGASKALLAGIGAVLLYLTQGPRKVSLPSIPVTIDLNDEEKEKDE